MKNNFERSCDLSQAPGLLQQAAGIVNIALNVLDPGTFQYEVISRFQEKLVHFLKAVDLLGEVDEVKQEIALEPKCLHYVYGGEKPMEVIVTTGQVVVSKYEGPRNRLKPACVWFPGRILQPTDALDLAVDLLAAYVIARWLDAHVTTPADLGRVRIVGGWLVMEGREE